MHPRDPTLDDLARIDIRRLRRDGYLDGGRKWIGLAIGGVRVATLLIGSTPEVVAIVGESHGRKVSTRVELDYVELTFGPRPYFRCPRCDQRCSLLYLYEVVCRGCVGYRYLSETLGTAARLRYRRERAREDLGFDEHGRAVKPKGMHTDTWLHKWQRYWDADLAIAQSLRNGLDELDDVPEASSRGRWPEQLDGE